MITLEQGRSQRSRLRVIEAALELFAEEGFDGATFAKIAGRAGVSVGLACRYFPTKEHLVLAAYGRLADALVSWAGEAMPEGTIAQRFAATLAKKLELIERDRLALTALAARALDPNGRAAVLGAAAEPVRAAVSGVFLLVVRGATDAPDTASAARLARALYALHLLVILVFVQDMSPDGGAARDAAAAIAEGLAQFSAMLPFLLASPTGARVEAVLSGLFGAPPDASAERIARVVLERIFRRRRVLPGVTDAPSEAAFALHLPRVRAFIEANVPIELVLPGFPAKAPNPNKVLGKLPDAAERIALESLSRLLADIREAYPPGARLVIASDGGVFADVVGVRDADVAAYRAALAQMITELDGARSFRVFGLDDAFGDVGPKRARDLLLARYGEAVETLRTRAERSPQLASHLDGMHRFLFEDEVARADVSRSQARKVTRAKAYEVLRRSEAWGRVTAAAFPSAVRLSIHPQADVSEKIGVHLAPTDDAWLTPWHAAAVLGPSGFRLMHKSDAEALSARVIEEDGRPQYLEVAS